MSIDYNQLENKLNQVSAKWQEIRRKSSIYDQIVQKLDIADNQDIVLAEIEKFLKYEDALFEKQQQIDSDKNTIEKLQSQLQDLQNNLNQLKEDNQNLQNQVEELKKQNQELENEIAKQAVTIQLNISEINDLTSKLNSLKEQLKQKPLSGFKSFLWRIIQRYRR
jgi:predicted RNase H-like nuclease (RuvC/YqgF family)